MDEAIPFPSVGSIVYFVHVGDPDRTPQAAIVTSVFDFVTPERANVAGDIETRVDLTVFQPNAPPILRTSVRVKASDEQIDDDDYCYNPL